MTEPTARVPEEPAYTAADLARDTRRNNWYHLRQLVLVVLEGLVTLFPLVGVYESLENGDDGEAVFYALFLLVMSVATLNRALQLRRHVRSTANADLARAVYDAMITAPERNTEPGPTSWAYQPLLDLAEVEHALAELLDLLEADGLGVREARKSAADAAAIIRTLGERLLSVERAREVARSAQAHGLTEHIRTLHGRMEARLTAYRGLLVAAGAAVAALAEGGPDLTEAADHLTGVAEALRQFPGR
ncbi:hypothetical protein V5P93_005471 [Actinokineospora auranticolor]|uniref:Uncharacterized protein n=1 Tax=Actinokineospora auranticolor TaxID=155976 RepID=A0A2S6GQG8_9PSEU|nr:hypothetical protein [Actinokineospora auranticolor]PPK67498.1 hypothetical protein CLV40_107162 [Actinokineospora auranticolor]